MAEFEQERIELEVHAKEVVTKPQPGWWKYEGKISNFPISGELCIVVKVDKNSRVLIPGYSERPSLKDCNGVFTGPIYIKNIVGF